MQMSPYAPGVTSEGSWSVPTASVHHYAQPHQPHFGFDAEKPIAAVAPAPKTSGMFWLREDRAGAIIGQDGAVKEELQTRSKTDIQVHNDVIRNGHKLVTVLGDPKQINVAIRLIAKTVK